jgi:hypothetical protein
MNPGSYDLVAVGCSLGGMRALETLLTTLPPDFTTPIAVVQHRHKQSNEQSADVLPAGHEALRRRCGRQTAHRRRRGAAVSEDQVNFGFWILDLDFGFTVQDPIQNPKSKIQNRRERS